ncbi:hypothetical protein [Enterococcus hirae]|uniref:Rgg family transcriptional regulator n=1 Tax=Enterococcus hirae TaxID=1354 RepID=UPI001D195A2F|nr:hypothetical protein [Enterococcus hirae]MCC4033936.1 hypothetical protein [Enterococcus hirae]
MKCQDYSLVSSESRDLLKDNIFAIPNWTDFKLTLYANVTDFYSIEVNNTIISSLVSKGLHSFSSEQHVEIMTILTNFIGSCIEENQDELAKYYWRIIKAEPTTTEHFIHKYFAKYYELLLNYRENASESMERKIYDLIEFLSFVHASFFGNM